MRRIKAVASPSQLCLWDELDESAALRRNDAAPTSSGGGGLPTPPAPAMVRPDVSETRPADRKTP